MIGATAEDIPFCVAIGDNQASFLGAAGTSRGSMLINIGTGSQVSVLYEGVQAADDSLLEVRPYLDGMSLLTGSPLCGGSAYALLERFFRQVLRMVGMDGFESVYPYMDALLSKASRQRIRSSYPPVSPERGPILLSAERSKISVWTILRPRP